MWRILVSFEQYNTISEMLPYLGMSQSRKTEESTICSRTIDQKTKFPVVGNSSLTIRLRELHLKYNQYLIDFISSHTVRFILVIAMVIRNMSCCFVVERGMTRQETL